MNTNVYAMGIMSGTSMDGVDAVAIALNKHRFKTVIAQSFVPYAADLRQQLLTLQQVGHNEIERAYGLAAQVTQHYIEAAQALIHKIALPMAVIGCHGQTVRHCPAAGYSVQLFRPASMAEALALPVVSDFRSADLAAGGEGAPLVPAFHQQVFGSHSEARAVLNIGGIANISLLPGRTDAVTGFDTGAGNMLLDAWMRQRWHQNYDKDGALAATGQVNQELFKRLLAHPFLAKMPPKSAGREDFSLAWLNAQLPNAIAAVDVLTTLVHWVAETIAQALRHTMPQCQRLIVAGGGARNQYLYQCLQQRLPHLSLQRSDDFGLPAEAVEGAAFAWMAYCRLHQIPCNLPAVTGAQGCRVLGALWQVYP